jgi:hypothetical protein
MERQRFVGLSTVFSTLLIAATVSAQPVSRDLRLLFNADGYMQTTYSGPTVPGTLIFFDDEPIRLLVRFVNWSEEPLTLGTGGVSPGEAVTVRLHRRSDTGSVEVPVSLSVNGDITGGTLQSAVRWQETIPISPKGFVTIPTLVQSGRLEPGVYELRLNQLRVSCAPECRVLNHAGQLEFNISHADDLPKQLDVLLRRAYEAIKQKEFTDAEALLKRTLKLYPQTSVAYQLMAQRAEQLQNWKDVAAAYDRAAELIETGADRLRPDRPGLAGDLRHLAAEARKRQDKR